MARDSAAAGALLAQVRPGVTTPVVLFTAVLATEITRLVAVNVGAAAVTWSLYHDDAGGSTFDPTTALLDAESVARPGRSELVAPAVGSGIHMRPGAQLAVAISSANDLTVSVYGITGAIAEE